MTGAVIMAKKIAMRNGPRIGVATWIPGEDDDDRRADESRCGPGE